MPEPAHHSPLCHPEQAPELLPWMVPDGLEMHFLPQKVRQHFLPRGQCLSSRHRFRGLCRAQVKRTGGQDQALPATGGTSLLQGS